tara:strand:- start:5822 stop:6544 length:723 start_codon:yes stop_codon:yes gene_type:complete
MHTCSCGKEYTRLKNFQEHRALCEMLKVSRNENVEYLHDIPSQLDMWLAMKVIIRQNINLKNEMKNLKSWVNKQKKKLCLIDWLNEKYKPVNDYLTWISEVELTHEDLYMVFEHNFVGGIIHILSRLLCNNNTVPIKAFDQKLNTLFVYFDGKWGIMDHDILKNITHIIQRKLYIQLNLYNNKNKCQVNDTSNNDTWYKNVAKVMGGDLKYDTSVNKIRLKLYNKLKYNLKNVVEYEFTF